VGVKVESIGEHAEGSVALELVAAGAQHVEFAVLCPREELTHETRLSDACLALHDRDATATLHAHVEEGGLEALDLGSPTDERRLFRRSPHEIRSYRCRLAKPLSASYDQAMAEAIVGRGEELSHVVELLEDKAGSMRALVIDGEAGIGKTTLWRQGVERARARSLPTLIAQPAQAESLLPFAALGDLLAPVLDERLSALALPLRTALEVALQRRAAEEPAEQLAVSRASGETSGPCRVS
jgi:hypothetical protein